VTKIPTVSGGELMEKGRGYGHMTQRLLGSKWSYELQIWWACF